MHWEIHHMQGLEIRAVLMGLRGSTVGLLLGNDVENVDPPFCTYIVRHV